MSPYLALPNELIILTARGLNPKQLSYLIRANRHLFELLKPELYRHATLTQFSDSAFFCAAATGNELLIRTILAHGHEQMVVKTRAGQVLHKCPGECDDEVLQTVIAEGANIVVSNCRRDFSSLQALIPDGPSIAVSNCRRDLSGLHWACRKGSNPLLKIFLESGADSMILDTTGRTPLHMVKNGEAARLLIQHGADPMYVSHDTPNIMTPLESAVQLRKWDVAKAMLEVIPVQLRHQSGKTSLHIAAELDDEVLAQHLLAKGADPAIMDDNKNTALHLAVPHKNAKLVRLLLEHGADPTIRNKYHQSPIFLAHRRSFNPVYRLLLRYSRTDYLTKQRRTLLHLAIEPKNFHQPPPPSILDNEDITLVKHLIEKGVNINAQDATGRTALAICTQYGCEVLVKLLLEKGADPNIADLHQTTALHIAVQPWSQRLVGALLAGGADVNAQDADGRTVLHLAAMKDMSSLLSVVLKRGADINRRDRLGQTALHMCAVYDGKKAMKVLLDAGADSEARDSNGRKVPEYMLKTCSEVISGLSFGMEGLNFGYQRAL